MPNQPTTSVDFTTKTSDTICIGERVYVVEKKKFDQAGIHTNYKYVGEVEDKLEGVCGILAKILLSSLWHTLEYTSWIIIVRYSLIFVDSLGEVSWKVTQGSEVGKPTAKERDIFEINLG